MSVNLEAVEKEYSDKTKRIFYVTTIAIILAVLFFILFLVFAVISSKKKKQAEGKDRMKPK